MIELIELENGKLQVKFTGDEQDKLELEERAKDWGINSILAEILEPYTCNGWGFHLASDLGQLSESPVIAKESYSEEDGSITLIGKAWYSPNYAVQSEIELLLEKGYFEYDLWEDFGSDGANFGGQNG